MNAKIDTAIASITSEVKALEADRDPLRAWFPALAEQIVKSWYQDDLAEGPVAAWSSRGVKPTTARQADVALQPTRLPNGGGVFFKRGTKQTLNWSADADAPYLHRWWLVIARADLAGNPKANDTPVVCVNGAGGGAAYRQPRISFSPLHGTFVSGLNDGAFKSEAGPCAKDLPTWNVMVGYRRGWITQAVINGVKTLGQEIRGLVPNANSSSFMGDVNNPITADMAIDCIIIGQGELTDEQITQISDWGMLRARRQMAPGARYSFDPAAWATWAAIPETTRYANRGKPAPAITGYQTVFRDDFETMSVVDDLMGAPGSNWFAPTQLANIGGDAKAQRVATLPTSYVHGPVAKTLSLRLLYNGGWKTGAFSSVNNNGQGRSWEKGIFEIRAKFPKMTTPRPGFFPAFWAYGVEHLFMRTRNRLETDFFEYDGLDGSYLNITQHVHKPPLAFDDASISQLELSDKMAGYPVGPATGFPGVTDIYDGEFHTWYAQIEDDYTYFVIDGYEVARVPTTPELAAKKYILVDWALSTGKGKAPPDQNVVYDMVIDYIQIRQKAM